MNRLDIGDGSVFMKKTLTRWEKKRLLAKFEKNSRPVVTLNGLKQAIMDNVRSNIKKQKDMKKVLTQDGKKRIQKELEFLQSKEKYRLISELADARDRGGIEENSEYSIAREEYEKLQLKISKLEDTLRYSTVVQKADTSYVSMLSTVKVINGNKEMVFTIVPEDEIDPKNSKISQNSPIGSGLMGAKVGDNVKVKIPIGILTLEILEIS